RCAVRAARLPRAAPSPARTAPGSWCGVRRSAARAGRPALEKDAEHRRLSSWRRAPGAGLIPETDELRAVLADHREPFTAHGGESGEPGAIGLLQESEAAPAVAAHEHHPREPDDGDGASVERRSAGQHRDRAGLDRLPARARIRGPIKMAAQTKGEQNLAREWQHAEERALI